MLELICLIEWVGGWLSRDVCSDKNESTYFHNLHSVLYTL